MTKLISISPELQILYREMVPADIPVGLQLCQFSRWNQVARDWELFLKLNPQGCLVAIEDERVVGTVATLRFQDRFSWISMVLVNKVVRGCGIGTQLLHEAMRILGEVPAIRLDATPAGHAIYRKLGFADEYWLARMEASHPALQLPVENNPAQPMTLSDLADVFQFDLEVFWRRPS